MLRTPDSAYIEHWLKALKNDRRAIFQAAAHAQRAVDYLHGLQEKSEAAWRRHRLSRRLLREAARFQGKQ